MLYLTMMIPYSRSNLPEVLWKIKAKSFKIIWRCSLYMFVVFRNRLFQRYFYCIKGHFKGHWLSRTFYYSWFSCLFLGCNDKCIKCIIENVLRYTTLATLIYYELSSILLVMRLYINMRCIIFYMIFYNDAQICYTHSFNHYFKGVIFL